MIDKYRKIKLSLGVYIAVATHLLVSDDHTFRFINKIMKGCVQK